MPPERTWQLIFRRPRDSWQTPKNLLSLLRMTVWQKPYRMMIFIIAKAKVFADGLMIGSMAANVHIPQQAMRYVSDPSKPICFPAEYSSMWSTIIGALIGK